MSYYERETATHVDGTPIFKTDADEQSENEVAELVANAWRCSVRSFGRLAPIDFYAVRDGRLAGVLELKSRSHSSSQYETVFLNVRKWLSLILAETALGVPAVFVVRFTDGIYWTRATAISSSAVRIGGCVRTVKSRNDVEPVLEVPVAALTGPLVEFTVERSAA